MQISSFPLCSFFLVCVEVYYLQFHIYPPRHKFIPKEEAIFLSIFRESILRANLISIIYSFKSSSRSLHFYVFLSYRKKERDCYRSLYRTVDEAFGNTMRIIDVSCARDWRSREKDRSSSSVYVYYFYATTVTGRA